MREYHYVGMSSRVDGGLISPHVVRGVVDVKYLVGINSVVLYLNAQSICGIIVLLVTCISGALQATNEVIMQERDEILRVFSASQSD